MNVKHCMFRNYKILFQIQIKKNARKNFKLKLNKKYIIHAVLCNVLLVAQSCPTLCNCVDCSPPGSSVHEDSPGKNTREVCHTLLWGIFPTQELN